MAAPWVEPIKTKGGRPTFKADPAKMPAAVLMAYEQSALWTQCEDGMFYENSGPFEGKTKICEEINQEPVKTTPDAPADFVRLFGSMPKHDALDGGESLNYWLQRLRYFKGTGTPEFLTASDIAKANAIFAEWGMTEPEFYEGRYGWTAIWNDSPVGDFEQPASGLLFGPQNIVANYQREMYIHGLTPEKEHPWVPPNFKVGD